MYMLVPGPSGQHVSILDVRRIDHGDRAVVPWTGPVALGKFKDGTGKTP